MDFDQLYEKTEISVKLEFLLSVLSKNEGLRNQFIEYCKPVEVIRKSQEKNKDWGKMISKVCMKFKNELESLDFDNMDWSLYVPRHTGYIEDYEAYEHFAEDNMDDIFGGWKHDILILVNDGQLVPAVCNCLGMYDACLTVEIKGANNIFDDLTDTLLLDHEEMMREVIKAITTAVISIDQAFNSVEAVLDHYLKVYPGMKNYLRYFEPLFISLVENGETASRILEKMTIAGIDDSLVPRLAVKLASFDEDPLIWREKAEEFIDADLEVAKQLLAHYWLDDPECFRLQGKRLFRLHPSELCDFFRERLFPKFDMEFFKEVLWFQTLRDKNPDQYQELREFLDEGEKQKFIGEITWDEVFKVKVLEMEKRYDEILHLVQKEVKQTWHFPELITPILNIFPAEAFELIKIKTAYTMENEKGRSSYKRISLWLQLALQIEGKEDDARHLIHALYNRKPALPALKDEMRKAGVV
ncbi:MAG: hypothetical protein WCI71_15930 [Bacteroidota bacterium]